MNYNAVLSIYNEFIFLIYNQLKAIFVVGNELKWYVVAFAKNM